MSFPRCRLCSTELRHTFVDLGMSPPCESYLTADQLDAGETFYPLHVRVCENCLLVQLAGVHPGGGHLLRLRVLLLLLRLLGCARPPVRRGRGPHAAARTGLLRGRGGQQRRLPAAAQRRPRHPLARHRAGRQHRRGRSRPRASRPRWRSSASRSGRDVAARHGKADLVVANNVFAHVPDIVDFSKGLRALVADHGRCQHRDPAPAAADRGQRVRHDLPRALLLPLPADRPAGARGGRPHGGRHRGAAHPRGLDAALVGPGRQRGRGAALGRPGARRRGGRGTGHPRGSRGVRASGGGRSATTSSSSCSTASARASGSPATARPARATPCSTTAASGPT